MILSAGVLWDVRMASEVHRFGSFATMGGVFHPYRSEIVINTKVNTTYVNQLFSIIRCWTSGHSKLYKKFPGWSL